MTGLLNIARWESFRLVRRKMPWILLAIFFAFTQLAVWGTYVTYTSTASGSRAFLPSSFGAGRPITVSCAALRADPAAAVPAGTSQQAIEAMQGQCAARMSAMVSRFLTLSPTGAMTSALGVAASLGLILLGILSASTVGMDYGLGTLRPILARGTGRTPFLAGKYLMLVGVTTCALLVICAFAAGSGALAAKIAPPPPVGATPAATFGAVAASFAKTWGALVAYLTMAASVTLLVRSTAGGMAISLAYYVAEGILIRLLNAVFESFDKVADYLPMRNISALTGSREGLAAALGGGSQRIDTLQASLVLAGWALLFAIIAALVFQRRDVGSAGGS